MREVYIGSLARSARARALSKRVEGGGSNSDQRFSPSSLACDRERERSSREEGNKKDRRNDSAPFVESSSRDDTRGTLGMPNDKIVRITVREETPFVR